MKRLWINRFDVGTSRKYFRSDYYRTNYGDKCAICRLDLNSSCLDCKLQIDDEKINNFKNRAKYVWMFLLIEYKRKESPFNVFDLNIITRIYKHCIEGDYEDNECTIVLLKCKHVFHKHCFEKWIHKRLVCPLCNGNVIMPKSMDNYKYSQVDGMLIKIQPSKYDVETFYQMQDDTFHIQGTMCKILKHHKMGYDRETFYKLVLGKFPRWIDTESFDKAINDLIRRDYICFDYGTKKYVYVP